MFRNVKVLDRHKGPAPKIAIERDGSHPFFIFHSMLIKVKRLCQNDALDIFFHPVGRELPPVIRLNEVYELELVFPCAKSRDVLGFMACMKAHVFQNFVLERVGPLEVRSVDIVADDACLFDASNGITMNFLTPLTFTRGSHEREPCITSAQLMLNAYLHLAHFYALPWPWLPPAVTIMTDTDDMRYFQIETKSKSCGKRRRIAGWVGPLHLTGDCRPCLPLLLAASELHMNFGKGDPGAMLAQRNNRHQIINGLGAFELVAINGKESASIEA